MTHVDCIIIVSPNPQYIMSMIEKEFILRNVEDNPKCYPVNDIKEVLDKYLHSAPTKYISEMLRKY